MSLVTSPLFLRRVLQADAVSCIACGALQLALPAQLSGWLGLPVALLVSTGVFLLAYAAFVLVAAVRQPVSHALVRVIVAGNVGWALACVAVLVSGTLAATTLGVAYVLMQAATVVVLAELQWTGLRRSGARLAT